MADYAMDLANSIHEEMMHPGWEVKARAAIADARMREQRINDEWLRTFPVHAEDALEVIEYLSPNKSPAQKLTFAATWIKNHALYPQNWPECRMCKVERMDKEI